MIRTKFDDDPFIDLGDSDELKTEGLDYSTGLGRRSEPRWTTDKKQLAAVRKLFELYFTKGKPNECWLWQGPFTNDSTVDPHGTITVAGHTYRANLVSHWLYIGPTEGRAVKLSCGRNSCVNPAHLRKAKYKAFSRMGRKR